MQDTTPCIYGFSDTHHPLPQTEHAMATRGNLCGGLAEPFSDLASTPNMLDTRRRSLTAQERGICMAMVCSSSVPHGLIGQVEVDACIAHGIRSSLSFANSPDVVALCHDTPKSPSCALFRRTRNARLIMSNIIPDFAGVNEVPYCIWYPDIATEETYRALVTRYRCMRYQVGRACAVAGYSTLYHELGLLPDVSIAEEARETGPPSKPIYDDIMARPARFRVMDDYILAIDESEPLVPANLNGDTAVRPSLDFRVRFDVYFEGHLRKEYHFDITEDLHFGFEWSDGPSSHLLEEHVPLLYEALPRDLPTVNKDLLILMAAYEGNIDRYARLRRPQMIPNELYCVIRGIYHHTTFARWAGITLSQDDYSDVQIKQAVIARHIMCNDISLAVAAHEHLLPYLIWYPLIPTQQTLSELARRVPVMTPQIAHACVYADYRNTYDELDIFPTRALWLQAKKSDNAYYARDLERRAVLWGINLEECNMSNSYEDQLVDVDKEPTDDKLYASVGADIFKSTSTEEIPLTWAHHVSSARLDLFILAPEQLKKVAEANDGVLKLFI